MTMIATRYRYADNIAYRDNLYLLKASREEFRALGGMVVLKDKVLAYAGAGHLVQEKPAYIINHADAYVWGATPAEALAKIKPLLNPNR
jgi:hypothetical protein